MIKYNIELFKIDTPSKKYIHFLPFLVRKFYGNKFDGTFTRTEFIKIGFEKFGYKKTTIGKIFDRGIQNNHFILNSYTKRNKKYYVLASNNDKSVDNILVLISDDILNKINFIKEFYTFCFLIIASRPFNKNENIKDTELHKLRGRTLNTIGKTFGNMTKNNVIYHINKGRKLFDGYFNIISRNIAFYDKKIPISNLYYFDGIDFMYIKQNKDYIYKKHKSSFISNFRDLTDYQLEFTYGIDTEYKNGIRYMTFNFGSELDLGKQFINQEGNILYNELYENYDEIINKIISQYK